LGCNPFSRVSDSVSNRVGQSIGEKVLEAQLGGNANVDLGGSLAANFPSDIPRYPGAKYVSSLVQGDIAIANFTTSDDAVTVSEWFEAQLLAEGYKRAEGDILNGTVRVYEKDNIHVVVQAMRADNSQTTGVSVQRSVTKK